jgi:hypothetical protein
VEEEKRRAPMRHIRRAAPRLCCCSPSPGRIVLSATYLEGFVQRFVRQNRPSSPQFDTFHWPRPTCTCLVVVMVVFSKYSKTPTVFVAPSGFSDFQATSESYHSL